MKKKLIASFGVMCAVLLSALSAHAVTCVGSNIPFGYVVVNIYTDPVRCSSSGPTNNAYELLSYSDKRIGDTMVICAGFSIPSGWVTVESYNNPTKCGGGHFVNVNKIMRKF